MHYFKWFCKYNLFKTYLTKDVFSHSKGSKLPQNEAYSNPNFILSIRYS
jgi:hypothetical protein